ncbi:Na+/H+ antiporter NhaC family protein [Bremerella sp. JC770]|uniref:Na+/H+ antiporter NhaC family protein n=1 Tax=Bremerella sp. JC770 TaxID=3232137 RepID=UPI0034579987
MPPHADKHAAELHQDATDKVASDSVPLHRRVALLSVIAIVLLVAFSVGNTISPVWIIQDVVVNSNEIEDLSSAVALEDSGVAESDIQKHQQEQTTPEPLSRLVYRATSSGEREYIRRSAVPHYGIWSLFPAIVAIVSCWVFREPLTSLLLGTISGAFILGQIDVLDQILLPSMATVKSAGILVLYLWLLGGLLGIWACTGTAQVFAEWVSRTFVKGPRSAKLVAWCLGILFFQGGTISTVIVGTAVRPISDNQKISHEELSYIVDSTASPIACLIAFNAWPGYIQALIFVPGIAYLATEQDRIQFFFAALPLSFYAIFAVLGTFLLAIDCAPLLGKRFRVAIQRARATGQLDGTDAKPLSFVGHDAPKVAPHYQPHPLDFCLPIVLLTMVAVGSFYWTGTPQVRWAFALALVVAGSIALLRGMSLHDLMSGVGSGLQSVVFASVILMLAVTLGDLTQKIGGGAFLVDLLGDAVPYWALPGMLFLITIGIAFSTGTSWGTFAVAFPLAMPLALALATSHGLSNESLYLSVCFACVLNGSVFGDQCSPISDTTVLSAMTSGADLMDHVLTQIVPASTAALLALACWTTTVFLFC